MGFRDWFRFEVVENADLEEASAAQAVKVGPANVKRSGFEYNIPPEGLNEYNGQVGGSDESDRRSQMQALYEAYLACPWAWASVQAIAKTITAGPLTFDWDSDDGEGDQEEPEKPEEVLAAERLFKYTNQREDNRQLLRGVIADLLVFGDAFVEVVWLAGIPVALYSLDSPTMYPISDDHGNISSYVQVTEYSQRATFKPHEVIHISLDSPRSGVFGVSPTQAALLPITVWLFGAANLKEIYRKGGATPIHVDFPAATQDNDQKRWLQQYQTRNLGPKNIGNPIMTKAGATINELGFRAVVDLMHILDQKRDEIVATFGVPPAEAGIIESGNIGGGTGESQHRSFLVTTCAPLAALVLEKLDFHLCQQGFGITGWHLRFDEVDMRDSQVIETIRDMRIRNGLNTLNRGRAEIGEPPVDGGDTPVLVDRQNIIMWQDMPVASRAMIAKNLSGTGVELDGPEDSESPAVLRKSDPPPIPPALAAGGMVIPGQAPPVPGAPAPAKPAQPAASADDDDKPAAPPSLAGGRGSAKAANKAASKRTRPVREDWSSVYRARLREALAELPAASGE